MEQLSEHVFLERVVAEGFPTVSAVVLAGARAFVVDTLMGPQDMQPVLALLAERAPEARVVVVNTHHHWDHVYGNVCFGGHDIVAHRACPRLMKAQERSADESIPLAPPEGILLPSVTFGDRVTYQDEHETLHLIHAPGHSEDSVVVFLEQARLALAGDVVEWPLPNLAQRDGREQWVTTLRQLKQLPVDRVVPSHGKVTGKQLIDQNERYIEGVYTAVATQKRAGVARHDLDVPVEDVLGEPVRLDEVYAAAHRGNLEWAYDEV